MNVDSLAAQHVSPGPHAGWPCMQTSLPVQVQPQIAQAAVVSASAHATLGVPTQPLPFQVQPGVRQVFMNAVDALHEMDPPQLPGAFTAWSGDVAMSVAVA